MKIPILLYHSVDNDKSNLSLSVHEFEKQIIFLKNRNFKTVNLDQIYNENHEKKVVITFDDGYKDLLTNVLPILKRYNFTATCFLVSNLLGKKNIWDINKENYIEKNLMNVVDIRNWVNNGMFIGSHTHNHLDLTQLNKKDLKNELIKSKNFLEDSIGVKINNFSYPYGKVNKVAYDKTREIFKNAVTTNRGRFETTKHNNFLIPRIDMGKRLPFFKIFLKLETLYEDIKFKKNELYL